MEPLEVHRQFAWQPLTPRGIAAFARATVGRLLLVQFLVCALTALVLVWFVAHDWFPTIRTAIDHLPVQANIQTGQLNWTGDSPCLLAEARFLALVVDLRHGQMRSPAHLQVEFGRNDVWVYSLFGRLQAPYPKGYQIDLSRETTKPWWGAWAPALLGLTVLAVVGGLIVSWTALATLYCVPAWLLGLYCDRELTVCGSWRLAGAALMPGALVLTASLCLYAVGGLDVPHLVAAWVLHFVLGWAYLLLGVLATPKLQHAAASKTNPFVPTISEPAGSADKAQKDASPNPFSAKRD